MRNQESAEQCLPIIMPQRRCGTPCHLTLCAMNFPETIVVRAQLLLRYVLSSFSLRATFPAVVALASFPRLCAFSTGAAVAQPSNLRSEAATQPFDFVRDSGSAHDDGEQGGILGGRGWAPLPSAILGPLDFVYWSTQPVKAPLQSLFPA